MNSKVIYRIFGLFHMQCWGGMIALIGFVMWDRRSAFSPVITRTRELEGDRDRTLRVLRDYAQGEPKLAEIMKNLGLM
ncbi:MAG: hypothetical protein V3W19_00565 [Desulfatiglandales bacterium]